MAEARQIRARTQAVVDTLHALRRRLPAATGNAPAPPLHHADESDTVADFMLGGPERSEARRLHQPLDQYVGLIWQWAPDAASLTSFAMGQKTPPGADGFGQFYFNGPPAAVALAALTRFEAQMLRLG